MEQLTEEIKTTYFIAIAVMLLLAGFIAIVIVIHNKRHLFYLKEKQLKEAELQNVLLQEELKRQNAIQKERERISIDMHDELGAGISALKLQTEFIKQQIDDPKIKAEIEELRNTSEAMNLAMREMLWSLNSENDNLGNFSQYIGNYAENFFLKSEIELHFSTSGIVPSTKLSSTVRRNLLLCVKESLNNVHKHSEAQHLKLSLTQKNTHFIIDVVDDGKGIPEKSEEGNGLHNIQLRMKSLGGNCLFMPAAKGLHLRFEVGL
ncbi:MAG: histidine kinase [Flavobacteriaceae bacterium]